MKDYFYILCLDERDSPNLQEFRTKSLKEIRESTNHRHFGLCGAIFDTVSYSKLALKYKHIQEKYIKDQTPFHYVDMLNCKDSFSFLKFDQKRKQGLYASIGYAIENTDFHIIGSFIDKNELCSKYGVQKSGVVKEINKVWGNLHPKSTLKEFNLYYLTLRFIIQDFYTFLNNRKAKGIIIAEARGEKEDTQLLKEFYRMQKFGAGQLSGLNIRETIADLLIIHKKQNHIGLQIADLTIYPIYDNLVPNHSYREDHFINYKLCLSKKIYKGLDKKGIRIFP